MYSVVNLLNPSKIDSEIMLLIGQSVDGQTNSHHHNLHRSGNFEGLDHMTLSEIILHFGEHLTALGTPF